MFNENIKNIKNLLKKEKGNGLTYVFNHENGNYYPIFFSEEQNKILFETIISFDKVDSYYNKIVYVISEENLEKILELAFIKGSEFVKKMEK